MDSIPFANQTSGWLQRTNPTKEWVKIPQKRCTKLVSGYTSHFQQVITAKGCSIKY